MRAYMRAFFWLLLLALMVSVLAAVGAWTWYFSPRAAAMTVERYGAFRQAWQQGALAPAQPGPLRAGVAVVEITPPVGTPLGGYGARRGRPSVGVHDPIFAKALVLDNGQDKVAIVTCDLIGVGAAVRRQVLGRVRRATGLDDSQLLICASHTHSGPGALAPEFAWQLAMGRYDARLRRELVQRISAAIISANGNLQPARIGWGVTSAPEFVANRRDEDPVRLTDPELILIRVDADDGQPLAALVNYAAHPTCLGADNMLVSGDFPGYLQRRLEQTLGGGVVAMYANGAQGDQSPRVPGGHRGSAAAEAVGYGLADRALEIWDDIETRPEVTLAATAYRVRLPEGLGTVMMTAATQVQALSVAGLGIMAVPGEMSAPLGLRLKEQARRLGFAQPCIFGLANDHIGYILTAEQYRRGGYERTVSGYGAGLGEFMGRAFAGLMMELAARTSDVTPMVEDELGRRRSGPARAYRRQGQTVLELTGNPYELGYRHGALIKPEFREGLALLRRAARRDYRLRGGIAGALFAARRPSYLLERHLPPEFILEIHGLADGLGVDYDTALFLQVMLAIVEQPTWAQRLGLGASCSNAVAFGAAARGGELIHGRNLDWGLGEILPSLATVAFYHPATGYDFVAVGWAGMVGCLTAMNTAGVSIGEESVASPLDTSVDGKPLFLLIREAIQYGGSLEQALEIIRAGPGTCGYHVTVCDGKRRDARTVEMTARHHATRLPEQGLLLGCVAERRPELFEGGHMPHPHIARADASSDARYARLRELAASAYGRIDATAMAGFLRDRINPRTGQPGDSGHSVCNRNTLHSVVMRPGRGDLWVAQGKMPAPTGEYVHYHLHDTVGAIARRSR